MACGNVRAEIQYLRRLSLYKREKPFQLFYPVDPDTEDQRSSNLEFEYKPQEFIDIRDNVKDFTLDSHGFEFICRTATMDPTLFEDRAMVESQYIPEMYRVLRSVTGGCDRIFIFDWRVNASL
jgi:hypothetical protein